MPKRLKNRKSFSELVRLAAPAGFVPVNRLGETVEKSKDDSWKFDGWVAQQLEDRDVSTTVFGGLAAWLPAQTTTSTSPAWGLNYEQTLEAQARQRVRQAREAIQARRVSEKKSKEAYLATIEAKMAEAERRLEDSLWLPDQLIVSPPMLKAIMRSQVEDGPGIKDLKLKKPGPDFSGWVDEYDLLPDEA